MNDGPVTRETLLLRIRNPADTSAWERFVDIYAPVIQAFARRKGLQPNDAADITQNVMKLVASSIEGFDYDPSKGKFRGWLYTITHNQIVNYQKRHGRHRGTGDTSVQRILSDQPSNDTDEREWETVYQHQLMNYAMAEVRNEFSDTQWQAFELTAVRLSKPMDVATTLSMSVGAVYVAKSRVIARLRQFVADIGDSWDETGFVS